MAFIGNWTKLHSEIKQTAEKRHFEIKNDEIYYKINKIFNIL